MLRFALVLAFATLAYVFAHWPAAHAQERSGVFGDSRGYVGGSLGWLFPEDTNADIENFDFDAEKDDTWFATLTYGRKYPSGFRGEIELGYGQLEVDSISGAGVTAQVGDAENDLYTATLNVFYDVPVDFFLQPYVGGGVGVAHQRFDGGNVTVGGQTVSLDRDSATDLMAFGELGVNFYVTPAFAVAPSYRYMWINDGGDGFDDTTAHIVRLGARYEF